MENEKNEVNPLEKAVETGLVALVSRFMKIKSLKVDVDFEGFTLALKSKEPTEPTPPAAEE